MRKLFLIALVAVGACAGILGLRAHDGEPVFPHRAHVYAGIACVTCHKTIATDGDDDPVTLPDDATCTTSGCHAKPHDTRSCKGCHGSPMLEGQAVEARQHLKFAHKTHLPQLSGDCMQCHVGVKQTDVPLRPTMSTCLGCHQHRDDFDPQKCSQCHRDLQTDGILPASHILHDADWIRRHGTVASSSAQMCSTCHTQESCAQCHGKTTAALPASLAFDDTTTPSIHRAGWLARHPEEAAASPGSCNTCHTEDSCRSCHERNGVAATISGAVSPHGPGWVGLTADTSAHGREARRDPAACAACHSGAGEQLCVGCHKVGGVGGTIHPPGWESNQPESALPCRLCHTQP